MSVFHFHKCANCGYGIAHDDDLPCDDFIVRISESCKEADALLKKMCEEEKEEVPV